MKRKRLLLVVAALVGLAAIFFNRTFSRAEGASVGFPQTTITVRTGQDFSLRVMVNDASDIYAGQFDTKYYWEYLEFTRVATGTLLSSDGASLYLAQPMTTTSSSFRVAQDAAATRLSRNVGVDGSGSLATVHFRALKDTAGGTTITLQNIQLVDRNAQEVERSLANSGQLKVIISSTAPYFVDPAFTGFLPALSKGN